MRKIAIVDDVKSNCLILQGFMKTIADIEVHQFTSPVEALEWCAHNEPDLILLDYMMPEIDGIEFVRRLRTNPEMVEIPVLMITGEESRETLYMALTAGATDFLRKPVDRLELVARAKNMLLSRGRQKALVEANNQLHALATTDPLTSLRNRRSFMEQCHAEMDRSHRFGHLFSIAMLDLDHFKTVNDTHGHDAGDTVLIKIARICTKELRDVDVVGRLGGEEFALVFPEVPLTGAFAACERLLAAIRSEALKADDKLITCTASIGLSEAGHPDDTVTEALKRADTALYAAKKNGRDRVETAESPQRDRMSA
jgi:two-component system, chemotaxis family, response regulator WspR